MAGLLRLRVGLGPLALLLHEPAEPVLVDRQALLGRHLEREVDREAVGVVQLEGVSLADSRCDPSRRVCCAARVEDLRARAQRLAERVLLRLTRRCGSAPSRSSSSGYDGPHRVLADLEQRGQGGLVDAEQAHRADDPAHQAAQHVAAALVARRDPVADEHEAAAHVVGDDAHPDVVLVVGTVALARELLGALG